MLRLYKLFFAALFSLALAGTSYGTVTHTGNPTIQGCIDTFTTSINGTQYAWDFGPNSYPRTLSGPLLKSAATSFLTPGSHTVRVVITTGGGPVGDSLTFNVQATSSTVTLTANKGVCQQSSPITFTASGGYAQYAFFVNDTIKILSALNVFSTAVKFGDSVRVFGLNGTCFSSAGTLYESTPSPATITSTMINDTICAGDLVTFTASPSNYDSFLFYVGGSLQKGSDDTFWSTNTLYDKNEVRVDVFKNGCRNYFWSNVIIVNTKPTPQINATASSSTICPGTQVTFTATAVQSNANLYTFAINGNIVQNTSSNTYTTSSLGNNDLVTITGSLNGCSSIPDSILITVLASPSLTITSSDNDNTVCAGSPVTFTASPSGFSNYQFYNNGVLVQSGSSNTYLTDSLKTGNAIYVTATTPGCSITPSDTIFTIITAGQPVDPGDDGVACTNNNPITLTGASPAGGTWTGPGITDSTGIFNPAISGSGLQTLTYTYTNPQTGCVGSGSVVYVVSDPPLISFADTIEICDDSVILSVSGAGLSTEWSPFINLSCSTCVSTVAKPDATITYYMEVTSDATRCSSIDSVVVVVNNLEVEPVFADTLINAGDSVTLAVNITGGNGSFNYAWTPTTDISSTSGVSPTVWPPVETPYTIVVKSGGCTDSATIRVIVQQADTATRIPSAFTPNNDGRNEVFEPVFKDQTNSATIKTFRIYNRYGQVVHDATTGWDGRFKGAEQPVGTYVYYLVVQFPNQPEVPYQGSVTLIR